MIIAPAKRVEKDYVDLATSIFESWGLKVYHGRHLFDRDFRFAGTDQSRLEDLKTALYAPEIKAIFSARGGYGSNRIADEIDWRYLKSHPKWLIGFSDITLLLGSIFNAGIASIHGIMPSFFTWENANESISGLRELLFERPVDIISYDHPLNNHGTAEAQVIGGNLSILTSMIGTSSDYDYRDKILLIEEISEPPYRIDRMMVQLKRSGKLDHLRGLLCGQFTYCRDDDDPFGKTAYEIVREHVTHLTIPQVYGFPVGHTSINYPVIIGGTYHFSVGKGEARLVFKK